MECNKDEALRAKELAEKKMQNNDFHAARRIALKAQQLFPELENVAHLLAVCHVHCSAQCSILGSEKDWYSILQVEKLADEVTIKKQYRKLALLLHPDKNKFPGAEAAFKLIGEAHLVLSDRGKRSLYDGKVGVFSKSAQAKPPPHQVKKNPPTWKYSGFQNHVPNGFSTKFSGLNPQKTTESNSSFSEEAFWTSCPFCNIKYQYYRNYVNKTLRCQKCSKSFTAYDIAAQGVPAGIQSVFTGSNWSQPPITQKKEGSVSRANRTATQKPAAFPTSCLGSQWTAPSRTMRSDSGSQLRGTNQASSDLGTQKSACSKGDGVEGVTTSNFDSTKPRKEPNLGNNKRKRGSKLELESSESCDTSSSEESDDIAIKNSVPTAAPGPSSEGNGFHELRRSSRQKHNISYVESEGDDDDCASPPKKFRDGKFPSHNEGSQGVKFYSDSHCASPLKQKESVSSKVNSIGNDFQASKNQMKEASASCDHEEVEIIDVDSETDATSTDHPCPEVFDCVNPEFSDFDASRDVSCFDVDQFWACYDPLDSMPRFYAHIRKVYSGGFRVGFVWLEPDPDEKSDRDWVNKNLPASCGRFKFGDMDETTARATFSHKVLRGKDRKKGSLLIYPSKGQIWALFKDWDVKWSTDPENHQKFKYVIVEVLSDFVMGTGIRVAFLDKVRGFVSLFQRRNESYSGSFLVLPNELFRFSHNIPYFRMNGTEKEGVPEGCFELDPAALPLNPSDLFHPFVAKDGTENIAAETNGVSSPLKSKLGTTENERTPTKVVDGENCVPRRSPRVVNHSPLSNVMAAATYRNNMEGKSCRGFSSSKEMFYKGVELNPQMKECSLRDSNSTPSSSTSHKFSGNLFYDFENERSEDKFKEQQIWALYEPDDKLPKMYGKIKKIVRNPFLLHVTLLVGCTPSKNGINPACGTFKCETGRPKTFSPNSFSHMLKAKYYGKKIEIYPREGQIWAVYKDWNAGLSSSDLQKGQYEIVEIVCRSTGCIRFSILLPLKGYRSVFESPKKQRPNMGAPFEVKENDLSRFSHQIPAYQLTTEEGGSLAGCWELDPASVPSNVFPAK